MKKVDIERPKWFANPESVLISVDPKFVKKSPLGNEVSIHLIAGGVKYAAVIPSSAINESVSKVDAVKVGEVGDNVLISFPPTSMGTATWSIDKSHLSNIISLNKG